MQHHAVVTLTFAEVGTCMDRSASVGCIRITNPDHRITPNHGSTPDLTQDHVRITPEHARITHHTGPDHTGSRPEHTGSRPDPVPEHARITHHTGPDHTGSRPPENRPDHVRIPCRNTYGSRITPDRITPSHVHGTHRITSGSRAGTRTDHVSNRRTGSTPDHVRRSRRNTPEHVRITRRITPEHARITHHYRTGSHPDHARITLDHGSTPDHVRGSHRITPCLFLCAVLCFLPFAQLLLGRRDPVTNHDVGLIQPL